MPMLRWLRRHLVLVAEVGGYAFWLLLDASGGPWWRVLIGAVVAAIVLARRWPGARLVPVAVCAISVSAVTSGLWVALGVPQPIGIGLSFAEQLALAVLVSAVLRRYELRQGVLLAGLAALAVVGSPLLRSTGDAAPSFGVLSALGWGGAVGIGLALRDADTRRRSSLEEVRSAERMELARELHDVVAHHVTGIIVAAQSAAVVARTSPDDVDRALAAIEHAGGDAMRAMRRMVGVLRGQEGAEAARTPGAELAGISALVARFDPEQRLVRLSTDPGLAHAVLPAGVAATGFRVVQEALTNVRRHAPGATAVEVDVRMREEVLLVSVRNDGVPATGPAPRPGPGPGGFGLVGMTERVTALDGHLTAGPTAPGVWTVTARLPLGGAR